MNGTAQRTHTRKTQELADIIGDTQAAVITRFEEVEARMHEFRERLSDERAHRVKLAQEQRDCIDHESRLLWNAIATETEHRIQLGVIVRGHEALVQRTFWGRLRWLVRGV